MEIETTASHRQCLTDALSYLFEGALGEGASAAVGGHESGVGVGEAGAGLGADYIVAADGEAGGAEVVGVGVEDLHRHGAEGCVAGVVDCALLKTADDHCLVRFLFRVCVFDFASGVADGLCYGFCVVALGLLAGLSSTLLRLVQHGDINLQELPDYGPQQLSVVRLAYLDAELLDAVVPGVPRQEVAESFRRVRDPGGVQMRFFQDQPSVNRQEIGQHYAPRLRKAETSAFTS